MCRSKRSCWIALMAAGCLFAGILSGCGGSGAATPSAAVSLTPPSLDLGSQVLNTTSAPKSVTLTNTGGATLNISTVALAGANSTEFALASGTTCTNGGTVAAGASCLVDITFTPAATGSQSASLSITDNAGSSPHSVPLTGTGIAPAVSLAPASLDFGSQALNTTSAPKSVTLTNTGGATLNISTVALVGANPTEFALASGTTCTSGGAVAAGASCQVNITFTPAAIGSRSATLSIADNANGSPHSVPLTGTGTAPAPIVSLVPASLDFGPQLYDKASEPRNVTLTNTGGETLTITSITVVTAIPAEFMLTNNCGASLAAGASCNFSVVFWPETEGARTATVRIETNAGSSPDNLPATGTCIVAPVVSLAPASLDFGGRNVNATSPSRSVTLTNTGYATLNISSVALSGATAYDFALASGTTCTDNSTVASGASCVLAITFAPTATGTRTAAITITDDALDTPQTVPLTGTGVEPPIGTTDSGQVQGVVEGNLIAFRGIPYAAPPVGDLRWKPPVAAPAWSGLRDASTFGNICPQFDFSSNFQGDEDCLTLNVFRAYPPPAEAQPVMVFIHGGGDRNGMAALPMLDAPPLATHGVVVVTIQYRLGMLGFLAHPLLTAEGGGSSGNYGLMDQIAALQWLQRNIAAFGGDPNQVMIFGESAGAMDVEALLASPAAQGLFARAGMESGGVEAGDVLSLDDSAAWYQPYVQPLNCDNAADVLACLRGKTAEEIVNALQTPPQIGTSTDRIALRLTREPRVLPVDPFQTLQQNGSPVPLLIGSNREDDIVLESYAKPWPILSDQDFRDRLHLQFDAVDPNAADQVYSLYPPFSPEYFGPYWALVAVHSDYYMTCKDCQIARVASGAQRPAVWRYFFTHTFENSFANNLRLRAFHGAEVPFVFGNPQESFFGPYTPTAAEVTLSEEMMGYWSRFAATGDPNTAGAVQWLPYDNQNEPILQLDDMIQGINGYHKDQCDYFATLPPPPL